MDALELAERRAECYAEGSDAPEWMRQEATMYALIAIAQELRRMNERADQETKPTPPMPAWCDRCGEFHVSGKCNC